MRGIKTGVGIQRERDYGPSKRRNVETGRHNDAANQRNQTVLRKRPEQGKHRGRGRDSEHAGSSARLSDPEERYEIVK